MSFMFDTEEEQQTRKERRSTDADRRAMGADTEIALGTRSLLAIFFGLVLICSIFFGLGYSVGRAGGSRAASEPSAPPLPDSHLSKPSPGQALTPVEPPSTTAGGGDGAAPESDGTAGPQPGSAETRPAVSAPVSSPASSPASGAQAPAKTAATPPAAKPATMVPAAAAASFMVQVAAVRIPQDAEILVDALKRHGYTAVVRNEPQDQLGPFNSRTDAMAMRAKLLTDGYNAVVK
jgi:cell division septation protein DedD